MYGDTNRAWRGFALIAIPIAVASVLTLAGCSSPVAPGTPGVAPETASASPAPSTDAEDHAHEGEEDDHPSVPVPEAGATSQADALSAATGVVTAFARPTLPEQQWWSELVPLLSQKGAVAYEGTLPSNIPVTAVTGAPIVLEASTDVATLVEVPTDAGPYIVTLVRSSASDPWLAERIRPAEQ